MAITYHFAFFFLVNFPAYQADNSVVDKRNLVISIVFHTYVGSYIITRTLPHLSISSTAFTTVVGVGAITHKYVQPHTDAVTANPSTLNKCYPGYEIATNSIAIIYLSNDVNHYN